MRTCTKCGKMFRVASHRVQRYQCDECKPRTRGNRYKQQQRREENMTNEGYKRLRTIEEKLEALEITVGIHQTETNTVVRDIETIALELLEKAVEARVEEIFDEKIALVDSMEKKFSGKLATVNSRVKEALEKMNIPTVTPPKVGNEGSPKMVPLAPLTKLQKERMDRLVQYLKYHGKSMTRKEMMIGVWHDVGKSNITKLLRVGTEHEIIELDEDRMDEYFKETRKTPDHGGPGRKLRFYRLKQNYPVPVKRRAMENHQHPYNPQQPMNPNDLKGEYFGNN